MSVDAAIEMRSTAHEEAEVVVVDTAGTKAEAEDVVAVAAVVVVVGAAEEANRTTGVSTMWVTGATGKTTTRTVTTERNIHCDE